jgi:TPR repeat protein
MEMIRYCTLILLLSVVTLTAEAKIFYAPREMAPPPVINRGVPEQPLLPMTEANIGIPLAPTELQKKLYNSGQFLDKDRDAVLRQLRADAANGSSVAEAKLGDVYFDGILLKQDLKMSAEWYRISSSHHNAYAQMMLGLMYQRGLGVARNEEEAVLWYHRAEKQASYVHAKRELADRYADPLSHLFNPHLAIMWYERAARDNDIHSMTALGDLYQQGQNIPMDTIKPIR